MNRWRICKREKQQFFKQLDLQKKVRCSAQNRTSISYLYIVYLLSNYPLTRIDVSHSIQYAQTKPPEPGFLLSQFLLLFQQVAHINS